MKINISNSNLRELNLNEVSAINGGESLWYWVAYGVGSIGRLWNEGMQMSEPTALRTSSGSYAVVL